jgi:hypothetical protein
MNRSAMGGRKDGVCGTKERGDEGSEVSIGVNSTGDEAVAFVEDGGNDGIGWASGSGRSLTEELLIFTCL